MNDSRASEIATNLGRTRQRIADACSRAGRHPDEITLVVVTKYFPASDVHILAELGVSDVGENRHQEAASKHSDCADLDLRWHFIGGLQSNKAGAVAAYADVVESIDRTKLVAPLTRGAQGRSSPLDCLVQVSLDEPGAAGARAGATPEEVPDIAGAIEASETLALRGLMAVAPLGADPVGAFARLAAIAEKFRREHPGAVWLSAGMSGDLEAAIESGATHVRIGSSVLGPRPEIK